MWRCTKIDKYEVCRLVRWSPIQSCFAPFGPGLLSFSDWPLARVTPRGTQNTSINSTRVTIEKLIRHQRLQQTPFNLRFGCVRGCMSIQPFVWCSKCSIFERQNSTHILKTSKYQKPPIISSLKIIGLLPFVNFLGPSEKNYNLYVYILFRPLPVCWEGEESFF